jgi:tetratricopeptide (TPR) repeat protein
MTQDVAYSSLLGRRRRIYHAAVGRGLEELRSGRLDEVVELLAHHFGKSAESEKAVDYEILAAEKAQRRWANTEALAQFEAALKRLGTMPDTGPNRVRRIDAVVKQAEIMFALGRYAEHVKSLEAIRELVDAAADPPRRAAWFYWTGFLHSNTGRPEVAIAYCREAAAIVEASGLDELQPHVNLSLANAYLLAGALRGALETGERALATFEDRGNIWWSARTLWNLSAMAMYLGEWERSLEYCQRALEYGRAVNDRRIKVVSWWRMGRTHIERGDDEAGVRCCQEALALSPSPVDAAMARAAQGYGMVRLGQVETGIAQLAEAVAWFDRSGLTASHCSFGVLLADSYLVQGEPARACPVLEHILTTSRELGYRHLEGVAHRLLGQALAGEDPDAAARHLETALGILEDVAARNEFAKALVAQGELERGHGDYAAARQLLERALALFGELGTLDWPPRVRGALAALPTAAPR